MIVYCEKGYSDPVMGFNQADNCQTLQYKVKDRRQARGEMQSSLNIHGVEVDLPKGEWEIVKMFKNRVVLDSKEPK